MNLLHCLLGVLVLLDVVFSIERQNLTNGEILEEFPSSIQLILGDKLYKECFGSINLQNQAQLEDAYRRCKPNIDQTIQKQVKIMELVIQQVKLIGDKTFAYSVLERYYNSTGGKKGEELTKILEIVDIFIGEEQRMRCFQRAWGNAKRSMEEHSQNWNETDVNWAFLFQRSLKVVIMEEIMKEGHVLMQQIQVVEDFNKYFIEKVPNPHLISQKQQAQEELRHQKVQAKESPNQEL